MGRGDSLLRQWQLLNILQKSRRGITLRDLAGYSERTIQRDLKLLGGVSGLPRGQRLRQTVLAVARGFSAPQRAGAVHDGGNATRVSATGVPGEGGASGRTAR